MKRFANFLYQPNIPLGRDGRLATGSKEHIALSYEAACEGMVLLKNDDHTLPLPVAARIAIFGTAQFDYVRGGGGSGDVTTAYTRNIYEGFKLKEDEGLVEIYEPVSAFYRDSVSRQKFEKSGNCRAELPSLSQDLINSAADFTDTAILCLCRYSWEGGDRRGVKGDGDYYLSDAEDELRAALVSHFSKVIVILDVGAVVDSGWFKDDPRIRACLLAWQAGIEGGLAIADTVCGLSNPSGRLVDTFPDSFDAFPSSEHFNDSEEYVDYTEDIYVGYRFFESFPEQKVHVNYPFGYGMSYTDFSVACQTCRITAMENAPDRLLVFVRARVTNTGSCPGRNAVGLYYQAPNGRLFKPVRQLGAFTKTGLLSPGESELVTLSFCVDDMASYDDTGVISGSSYILEAGTYRFFLGADVSTAEELSDNYTLSETRIVQTLSAKCRPHRLARRLLGDGSYEELPTDDSPVDTRSTCYSSWTTPTGRIIAHDIPYCRKAGGTGTTIDQADELNNVSPDFTEVANGHLPLSEFISRLPIEAVIEMLGGQPNTGVSNTFGMGNFPEFDIPNVTTADGPAGLRVTADTGVTTTAWPIATMLACTWDTTLVERVGAAAGLEVKENHIGLWLAPGMNIHRNPLCGRNFEYYSEDPLISGKMAAAMVRGVQSNRIGATIKHFCCNNKEVNRMCCDARVSERALREIYLKGFEIAVREASPWAVMSSYNLLNGTYTSQNADLLTGILRDEWGFEGLVTTDWMNWSAHVPEVRAGNDLKMPIGEPEALLAAYNSGELTRAQLETCLEHILGFILKFE